MNLGVTILFTVAIVFGGLYAWYKLQGTKEGDLINMGFGTYIERDVYKLTVTIVLILFLFGLLAALNAP